MGGASVYWLGVKVRCRRKPNKHEPFQGALLDSTMKEVWHSPGQLGGQGCSYDRVGIIMW